MKYKYNNEWKTLNVKVSDTYPIGAIAPYGGETAPINWLICDGSAISRTTYADLFEVIGTSFGSGDGSTTFNLPDLRSRVPLGKDSRDEDFDTIGETYGEKDHTLTIDEMPSHSHRQKGSSANSGSSYEVLTRSKGYDSDSQTLIQNNDSTGGGEAHNIVQPSLVTNYIIKAIQSAGVVGNVLNDDSNSDTDTYSCNYINGIVESGSNTNGKWLKYIDGTMICYGNISLNNLNCSNAWGAIYATGAQNINKSYAQTFIEKPTLTVCSALSDDQGASHWFGDLNFDNSKIIRIQFWRATTNSNMSVDLNYIAIGKWK